MSLRLLAAASILAAACGRGPAPVDRKKLVDDYLESLRPALATLDSNAPVDCRADRVKASSAGQDGLVTVPADSVKAVLRGEVPVDRLALTRFPLTLLPTTKMDDYRLTEAARAVEFLSKEKVLALVRVDESTIPEIKSVTRGGVLEYDKGRVAVTVALVEYPSGAGLCRTSFEAKTSPWLVASGRKKEDFEAAVVEDLGKNARQELQKILAPFL